MYLLLFLHVAFMFGAIALHSGPQVLALVALRIGRTSAIPIIASLWQGSVALISAMSASAPSSGSPPDSPSASTC